MPQTPHIERHFTASEVVRDIVIGMSDGLTVPFALAAGLTGGLAGQPNPTGIIVTAGLAEIAAGSIAMGLGGYLAAKSDAEHYAKEREREKREVAEIPHEEMREVAEVFQLAHCFNCLALLDRRNAFGLVTLWFCERSLHRNEATAQCAADSFYWQRCGRGCVCYCKSDFGIALGAVKLLEKMFVWRLLVRRK